MRRTTFRTTAALGAAVAALAAISTAATGAGAAPAASGKTAIPNSTPTWLGHAKATATPDTASTASTQTVRVYLAPKGGLANLEAAVTAVSTPGSASYRKFLTTTQYYAQYAPTAAATKSVTSWLTGAGLKIADTDAHNRYIDASGTTSELDSAFGVTLGRYSHDGQNVVAPDGATYVPTSLASSILGVDGLDTTVNIATTQDAPPPAFNNGRPCSLYYGQLKATYEDDYSTRLPKFDGTTLPYAVCGYTGPQLRAAYETGVGSLDGAGATVGINDAYAAPTITTDANTYAKDNGDGAYGKAQLTQTQLRPFTHASVCGPSGWYGEETLDIEAVHAMAPAADIHFYGASSCYNNDLLAAARQAVDDDTVQVISNSYGDLSENASAAYIAASEQVFMQGAMEGIGFTFSSGDDGDELATSGIKQADYQTSDPYVTSVGGTSTAIGQSGAIAFQTGWGTEKYSLSSKGTWSSIGYIYGSGGGYSTLFPRPSYQDGVVPADDPTGRAVPDVAMDADPTTGMLVGETQTNPDGTTSYGQYRIGGTSLASPLFAGLTALRIEKAGGSLGFLNPAIYSSTAQFSDVKGTPPDAGNVRADYANGFDNTDGEIYSVRTFDQDSSLTAVAGWDDVTGVGVPKATWATTP